MVSQTHSFYRRKSKAKDVKYALGKMKNREAVSLNFIPINTWKCIGNVGFVWLAELFNKILGSQRMSNVWRENTLIQIYEKKGDL